MMPDCGACGRDVSTCSCDFGVIRNATEIREFQESNQQQHTHRSKSWQAPKAGRSYCDGKGREEQ
jgi:hypothetical protein